MTYGTILGAFVVPAGVLVIIREVRPEPDSAVVAPHIRAGTLAVGAVQL
jgi:hypothetical protein